LITDSLNFASLVHRWHRGRGHGRCQHGTRTLVRGSKNGNTQPLPGRVHLSQALGLDFGAGPAHPTSQIRRQDPASARGPGRIRKSRGLAIMQLRLAAGAGQMEIVDGIGPSGAVMSTVAAPNAQTPLRRRGRIAAIGGVQGGRRRSSFWPFSLQRTTICGAGLDRRVTQGGLRLEGLQPACQRADAVPRPAQRCRWCSRNMSASLSRPFSCPGRASSSTPRWSGRT
jgi:hypothetical protein